MQTRAIMTVCLCLAVTAGCDREQVSDTPSGGDCQRAPERSFEAGAVIHIGDVEPPCRLEFQDTGVVLRGDPTGARPDPGRSVVRDSQGRYYTANAQGFQSVISLWSAEGEYLMTFGGPGDGPGELSTRGGLTLYVDRVDRLHVRDGGIRWSVFDEEQRFVRSVPAALGTSRSIAFFTDGSALSAASFPVENYFAILDSTGGTVRTFAPVDPAHSEAVRMLEGRSVTSTGDSSFWATPPSSRGHSPVGYRLEEWSTSGMLLRTIERDVPWYRPRWPPPPMGPEGGAIQSEPTRIAMLHVDDAGLLLVVIVSESSSWRPISSREFTEMSEEERATMYDIRLEVIDTRSGSLLASEIWQFSDLPTGGWIPRTQSGSRHDLGEDLIPVTRIIDYRLVGR